MWDWKPSNDDLQFHDTSHVNISFLRHPLPSLRRSGELSAQRGLPGQRRRPEETDEGGSLLRSHATSGLRVWSPSLPPGLIRLCLQQQDGAGKNKSYVRITKNRCLNTATKWTLSFLFHFQIYFTTIWNHKLRKIKIRLLFLDLHTCTFAPSHTYAHFTPIANPCSSFPDFVPAVPHQWHSRRGQDQPLNIQLRHWTESDGAPELHHGDWWDS